MSTFQANPNRNAPNGGIPEWLQNAIDFYTQELEAQKAKHASETVLVNEGLEKIVMFVAVGVSIALTILTYFFVPSLMNVGANPVNLQYFVYCMIGVYIILGFRVVQVNEVAGKRLVGIPIAQLGRGLTWLPPGIVEFVKETASFVQAQFPGDADHVDWSDEKKILEPNMVRPIRALFGEKPGGKLATELQLTAGIVFFVKWSLTPSRLFDLIKNIGPIDPVVKEVIKRTITGGADLTDVMYEVVRHMRDTGEAFVTEIAGKMSYNEMTENLGLVNELLKLRLQKEAASWGILIEEARINALNPGHGFNMGLQTRADAQNTRDATITIAEGVKQKQILEGQGLAEATATIAAGEKKRLTLEGEGRAAAQLSELKAQGKGYANIAKATRVNGDVVISAEVAKKLAEAGNVVTVGTQGVADLLGVVAASKKVGGTK